MPLSRAKSGFSLVELLVILGVSAVVMALARSAFSGSVESARRVGCAANLRSLHAGLQMYMDCGDGLLPYADVYMDLGRGLDEPFRTLVDWLDAPPLALGKMRTLPWACPSDREAWRVFGTSYLYGPYAHFASTLSYANRRGAVTAWFRDDPALGVFLDVSLFHAGRTQAVGFDGSIRLFRSQARN